MIIDYGSYRTLSATISEAKVYGKTLRENPYMGMVGVFVPLWEFTEESHQVA